MRQLALTVDPNQTEAVIKSAKQHEIKLFAQVDAHEGGAPRQMLIFEAPNAKIEGFISTIEQHDGLRAIFAPQGIISLRPPASEPEDQMIDIQPRSPLEVFLGRAAEYRLLAQFPELRGHLAA